MEEKQEFINSENSPEQDPQESEKGFRETLSQMEKPLLMQIAKRFGAAILTFLFVTITWVITKDWHYCIGYAISLFAAYAGMDIVWKYGGGKIKKYRVVICKSTRGLARNQLHIVVHDAAIKNLRTEKTVETKAFTLEVPAKERSMMTIGTIMDIFISDSSPNSILAYDILGDVYE